MLSLTFAFVVAEVLHEPTGVHPRVQHVRRAVLVPLAHRRPDALGPGI